MFQPGQLVLVLMDLQMPLMDGFQASQRMRMREQMLNPPGKAVVIIALRASVMGDVVERAVKPAWTTISASPFVGHSCRPLLAVTYRGV